MNFAEQPDRFDLATVLDAGHYADLVEHCGLAATLGRISRELGIELGEIRPTSEWPPAVYKTAQVASDRGPMRISLGLGRRFFSVALDNADANFVWASGGSTDLRQVVEVLDAWRRGATLRELGESHPFMRYSRLSQGYENGNPVETQWDIVIGDDTFRAYRRLLQALNADPDLRRAFPYFSH